MCVKKGTRPLLDHFTSILKCVYSASNESSGGNFMTSTIHESTLPRVNSFAGSTSTLSHCSMRNAYKLLYERHH